MKIDNKKHVYRIWLRKMIFTIVFTLSVVVVLFLDIFERPDSSITRYHVIIALALVFIIISVINSLRNPYYFYFEDKEGMLVFRFYPVGFFNSRKNSIEIPKQHLVKFEIIKFFLGMEEKLVLYQVYRKKVAKYPPISLSGLTHTERSKLKEALSLYVKEK